MTKNSGINHRTHPNGFFFNFFFRMVFCVKDPDSKSLTQEVTFVRCTDAWRTTPKRSASFCNFSSDSISLLKLKMKLSFSFSVESPWRTTDLKDMTVERTLCPLQHHPSTLFMPGQGCSLCLIQEYSPDTHTLSPM